MRVLAPRVLLALLAPFLLSASPCLAADPVSLLLKALAPMPLSLVGGGVPAYERYQNAAALAAPAWQQRPALVQSFVFDPAKFDDLTARYELYEATRELDLALQLQDNSSMTRAMNEYFRRIYQGYAADVTEGSRRQRLAGDESLAEVGRNMIVSYESVRLAPALEARLSYDVIGNSSHLRLLTPALELDGTYYSIDQRSPAALPETIVSVDEAMDQFTRFERQSAALAHTFESLGLRLKARYGAGTDSLDSGLSKTLFGDIAVQVVREDNLLHDVPGFVVAQVTYSRRF